MLDKKIIQIIPSDGWKAVYRNSEDGKPFACALPCWALVEDKDGFRYVAGMDTGAGEDWLEVIEDVGNFVGYTHESDKRDLELQFPVTG